MDPCANILIAFGLDVGWEFITQAGQHSRIVLEPTEREGNTCRGFIFYLDLLKLSELDKNSLRMERL